MQKKLLIILLLLQFSILQAREGSVVCLHGFFRSYKCMIPIGNSLKKEGFEVYLWNYPSRRGTIEDHAHNLVEVLQIIASQRPGEPIHFTTHSLGGIIVRAAVNHPDCPQEAKIGKAILLAPPNKGAYLARRFRGCPIMSWFFGKKSGRQLLTFNEQAMNDLGQFPDSMDILVIAGEKSSRFFQIWMKEPSDGKVTIEETRLSTPHDHHVLYTSHSWIMKSRETIEITKNFILSENRPKYLYKILSQEAWEKSIALKELCLPPMDTTYIHLSTEEQLPFIVQKYWSERPHVLLRIEVNAIEGDLKYESNPGGSRKYFHLYNGYIPWNAIEILPSEDWEIVPR